MRYLFFDTETTGLVKFRSPPDDPSQPRLVQLAAMLTENDGRVIAEFSLIVRPEGWTIPEQVVAVHGITTEHAREVGVGIAPTLSLFRQLARRADAVVAHNIDFDRLVMASEFARGGFGEWIHELAAQVCTMKMATPIMNLPGKKWPKLGDCYRRFFGESLEGAHDAMIDVRACARIFWHMKRLQAAAAPPVLFPDLPEPVNPQLMKSITE